MSPSDTEMCFVLVLCQLFSNLYALLRSQCNICDNDGVGFASQDGAVVKMKSCTMERNNLASKMKEELMLIPSSPDDMIASH